MSADPTFHAALRRHLDAIVTRNIEKFAATVTPDVRLVGTDGSVIEGARGALDAHREWFSDEAWRIAFGEPLVERSRGDIGWALVRADYEAGSTAHRFMLFLLFERGDDAQWRLVYDQGTSSA